MTTLAQEGDALKAVLDTVPDIGMTYSYQPVPAGLDWTGFVSKFTTTIDSVTQVRAWTCAYQGEDRKRTSIAFGSTKVKRTSTWLVRGYLGWQDPDSDATFRDLIERVVTALDTNPSLGGVVIDHDPCRVVLPNQGQGVLLGDVLCHYVEITVSPWVEETLATS